jgi:hypothetical protein
MSTNKIIFTLDDQKVVYQIKGDNKFLYFGWNDEYKDMLNRSELVQKIKEFRDKNFMVLETIKNRLI